MEVSESMFLLRQRDSSGQLGVGEGSMITSLWSLVAQTEQRVEGASEWSPAAKGHLPSKHDQTLQCVTLDMPFTSRGGRFREALTHVPASASSSQFVSLHFDTK